MYNFREFAQHGYVVPIISDKLDYIIKKKIPWLATSQAKKFDY